MHSAMVCYAVRSGVLRGAQCVLENSAWSPRLDFALSAIAYLIVLTVCLLKGGEESLEQVVEARHNRQKICETGTVPHGVGR